MNYKTILITAVLMIALCSPALAAGVWRNDIFYTDEQYAKISDGCTMVVDPQSKVESCYRDNNPAKSVEVYEGANTCTLEGNVRAGYNTLTKEVQLRNVNQSANETGIIIPIQPDGTFSYEGLAQGDYILKITPQFDGLGPEQVASVHCTSGVARPETELLGYAVGSRSNPKSATIAANLVCRDIDVKWMKLVKTGQHWVEPTERTVCENVLITPAYDEIVVDQPAHTEWRYKKHHWSSWSDWSDNEPSGYNWDEEHRHVPAVTHTVHHEAVYEEQCHVVTIPGYMVPEYGIEFFIEIDGAKITANNPNNEPVNIAFNFDVNYWVDKRPWDFNAMPSQIEQRSKNYSGTLVSVGPGVTSYHGVLTPDIDNAVSVIDFNTFGLQYMPYINNEQVTSTVWTH